MAPRRELRSNCRSAALPLSGKAKLVKSEAHGAGGVRMIQSWGYPMIHQEFQFPSQALAWLGRAQSPFSFAELAGLPAALALGTGNLPQPSQEQLRLSSSSPRRKRKDNPSRKSHVKRGKRAAQRSRR